MALTPFNSINGFSVGNANTVIDGNADVTVNTIVATGNVTAPYFEGDGSLLSGITGANVVGEVAYAADAIIAQTANIAYSVSGANVTSEVANAYYAQQAALSFVSYSVDAANVVGTVAQAAQANNSNVASTANVALSVAGANVSGTVANAAYSTLAGTVTTNAQPNITSVGILSSLSVTGNIDSSANIAGLNLIQDGVRVYKWTTDTTAPANPVPGDNWYNSTTDTLYQFVNDGSSSQWVDQSAPSTFETIGVGNVTNLSANATGNVGAPLGYFGDGYIANIHAVNLIGNGYQITNINGANITGVTPSATTAATVTTNAQPNITSVGNLTSLTVNGDSVFNGNLTVDGDVIYNNVTAFNVEDPIIGLGRGANNTPLTSNDGKDRGEQLWYYSGSEKSAFIGYDNSTGKLTAAVDASIANEVVTINSLGNIVLGDIEAATLVTVGDITGSAFIGDGGQLSNITGSNVTGNVALASTANVAYSVAGANVTGTVANASYATTAGTAYSVAGANVSGFVANATLADTANVATTAYSVDGANVVGEVSVAGYASSAGQVNGTDVTGAVALADVANVAYLVDGANVSGFVANATLANTANVASVAYSVAAANVSGTVANATYATSAGTATSATTAATAATVTTNAQPNITSVGTLSSLTVTGNVSANVFSGNAAGLTNIPAANISGNVSANNANTSNYVMAGGAQNGNFYLTLQSSLSGYAQNLGNTAFVANASTGTLYLSSSVTTGNITGGNLNTGGVVSATGNVVAGNVKTAGIVSSTGNVTGGNVLTSGLISATGNVSGGNLILTGGASVQNWIYVPQLWFVGKLSSDLSLTGNVDNTINWNSNSDPNTWYSSGNQHVTPGRTGWYQIDYKVNFTASGTAGTGQLNTQILVNGVQVGFAQATNNQNNGLTLMNSQMLYLSNITDYFTFTAYTTTNGQGLQSGSIGTQVAIRWIST